MENRINSISTELCNKTECTGCSACMNICPKEAIKMEYDSEGFWFPIIDTTKCIECRKCISVCSLHKQEDTETWEYKKVVSAFAKDECILKKGSSGAVFPILAESIIQKDGIVFGAAFDPEQKEVRLVSSDEVDLSEIFRSKYVQSRVGNKFKEVKKQLEQGRMVLFSGTPCQVEGLYRYLQKDYINLINVDFICHGVPSPMILKARLKHFEKKQKSKVINCTFREKDNGWRQQIIKLYFENGQVQKITSRFGVYYNLFINNYILRRSCYTCELYKGHKSDITLADSWDSNINQKGVSKVYVNTIKGEKILEDEIDKLCVESESVDDLEKYRHQYPQTNRNWFYKHYKNEKANGTLFELCRLRCLFTRLVNKYQLKPNRGKKSES